MRRSTLVSIFVTGVACSLSPGVSPPSYGWGLTGHKIVTDRAVRLLPTRVQGFYWENRAVLAELCIHPDLRKFSDRLEEPRHYIDLEQYPPDLPKLAREAVERFGLKKLSKSGWAPWHAQEVYARLVDAMRRKDYPAILRLSGDLSHYVADMHVPLHTTENYDGQLDRDTGVHARFESLPIDQFPEAFLFDPRPAAFVADAPSRLWAIVVASNIETAAVFAGDRQSAAAHRDSDGYSVAKARLTMGPLAARRLNDASHEVASFWYSAWVESGRPDLPRVDFSALAMPPKFQEGESLFYEGRFTPDLPANWPLSVRTAFRRIGDYLRLETAARLATVSWTESGGETKIRVTVLDSTAPVDEQKSQKALRRLILGARVKFKVRE